MSISSLSVSRVFPTIANDKNTPHGKSGSKTMVVECSSRPQKKGTSHHMKTRPKKSQPWDINRKPTVYAPLPPLPPDWTLFDRPDPALNISSSADDVVVEAEEEEEASLSPA